MSYLNWVKYWRNSLADAESGVGALTYKALNNFHPIDRKIFSSGALEFGHPALRALFDDEADEVLAVKVLYRPVVYLVKKVHGQDYRGSLPKILSPIICPIWVSRSGLFFSAGASYIPRDILAPLAEDKFTIAEVNELDEFLTVHSTQSYSDEEIISAVQSNDEIEKQSETWKKYYELAQKLFKDLCQKDKISEHYVVKESGYISKADDGVFASAKILSLYDKLSESRRESPLLETYAKKFVQSYEPCISPSSSVVNRIAHSSSKFPLAEAQRDALSHAVSMDESDILAVNGPPGTGKTTLVLSVVASLWVRAAIDEGDPPLIVAASTNNQAVTNIIEAFGKEFDEGEDELQGRWLPRVSSYGGYFPAASKEDKAAQKYQTGRFYSSLESFEFLESAEPDFLEKARNAFDSVNLESIIDVKEHLLFLLKQGQMTLSRIEKCWQKYSEQKKLVELLLGDEPKKSLTQLESKVEEIKTLQSATEDSLACWRNYLSEESLWLSVFSWIPTLRARRDRKRKSFIMSSLSKEIKALGVSPCDLEYTLEKQLENQEQLLNEARSSFMKSQNTYQALVDAESNWVSSVRNVFPGSQTAPSFLDIDSKLDTSIRFRMFRLAVHYWEARWLIACRAEGNNLESHASKKGLKVVLPRWRRRMMLTPCVVSTFHSLPSLMTHSLHNSKVGFQDEYLINTIDLLIVDEAGQVSPEIAGASFALARKALVIGDIHQIEPVRKLNACIDFGNLKQAGVINDDKEYEALQTQGRSAVTGSVMHIAQQASRYHYEIDAEPGMLLREHRRCFDELISYCNELCYGGLLLPKRGKSENRSLYPTFGYLHIDGVTELLGGSRANILEAETIAAWLNTNRSKIEGHFGEKLEKAVGVITPFSAQVAAISHACSEYNITAGTQENELTVGTVHSLQGAERKLIIFSQVYTKNSNGGFIDMTPTMLNVAVSRAKDSFLVFGDMDIIAAAHHSKPRGLLSKYLFESESNELIFSIGKRPDLLQICGQPKLLTNADEHDDFMMKLLSEVEKKIDIVSPWLIYRKLEETGILAKLAEVAKKGCAVTIHTDNHFNTTISNRLNFQKQKDFEESCVALQTLGIRVNVIDGVHSKLIFADDKYMAVGSFNWFSASRDTKFANVETSLVYVGDLAKKTKENIDFLNSRTYKLYAHNVNTTDSLASI